MRRTTEARRDGAGRSRSSALPSRDGPRDPSPARTATPHRGPGRRGPGLTQRQPGRGNIASAWTEPDPEPTWGGGSYTHRPSNRQVAGITILFRNVQKLVQVDYIRSRPWRSTSSTSVRASPKRPLHWLKGPRARGTPSLVASPTGCSSPWRPRTPMGRPSECDSFDGHRLGCPAREGLQGLVCRPAVTSLVRAQPSQCPRRSPPVEGRYNGHPRPWLLVSGGTSRRKRPA